MSGLRRGQYRFREEAGHGMTVRVAHDRVFLRLNLPVSHPEQQRVEDGPVSRHRLSVQPIDKRASRDRRDLVKILAVDRAQIVFGAVNVASLTDTFKYTQGILL